MKIVLVALAAVAALLVYIRFAPLSAARWDIPIASVDPADHGPGYLVLPEGQGGDATSPAYDLPPAELGRRVMDVALGEWRTVLLAGSPETGRMTFVARSRIFGFPDAVTVEVRALPGGGSTLAIFSRQRFGSGDGGVNEARVKRWLRKLAP